MRLAIITARGGSKRIPRKNLRPFCGTPIIGYSIRAAQSSKCFDEVMVSTDDEEIAAVAGQLGASVPFLRSAVNSDDFATTSAVLVEVLQQYQNRGAQVDLACCLYPTAPFVTGASLRQGLAMLEAAPEMTAVVTVARFSYPIQRALRIVDGRVMPIQPDQMAKRSQDLDPAFHDAGQFYWFRVAPFLLSAELLSTQTGALVVPEWQVQDIDSEEDWRHAEAKYRVLKEMAVPRP